MTSDEFVTYALTHKAYLMNELQHLRFLSQTDAEIVVVEVIQQIAQSKFKGYEALATSQHVLKYLCRAVMWKHSNMSRCGLFKNKNETKHFDVTDQKQNQAFVD